MTHEPHQTVLLLIRTEIAAGLISLTIAVTHIVIETIMVRALVRRMLSQQMKPSCVIEERRKTLGDEPLATPAT